MKKRVVVVLFVAMLVLIPIVSAQTYSGVNRFTDNVKMFFASGDEKVRLALEIREKEVDSAMNNFQNQEEDKAIKNLERARKKLQVVQEKVSLNTSDEIKESVDEIVDRVSEEDNLSDEFDEYLLEEEKTQLVAELTEKTFEYCKELAKEDFSLMLEEEMCNPDSAVPGLEKELEELKDIQIKLFVKLMLEIRSCIDDPGTCNCEANVDVEQKAKCEKMVALAVRCEYRDDETACEDLDAMRPSPGDGFAKSFVPDFLMNLFAEKHDMVEYGIEHSDGVPEECWNENDKPECEKYEHLKENELDWDEYGNYRPILTRGKKPSTRGIEEPVPTMQESIPECYDDAGNFLEEKCGKISVVWTEEGLINYIVEKQIDDIIEKFENKSRQHTIDVNGTDGEIDGEQNKVREIKREMNQINNRIVNITYAPGTGSGGGGVVIDGDVQDVVTDDRGTNVVDSGTNVIDDRTVDNGGGGGSNFIDIVDEDENPSEHGTVGD